MTPEMAVQLFRDTLTTTLVLTAPILVIGFIVGIIVNLVQVATSIQDSAFSALPRLGAFIFGTLILAPWMLRHLATYTILLFSDLSRYAR
jgi:flagellar biosynthetic protein FliQ